MSDGGPILGTIVLLGGAIVDVLFIGPFFMTMLSGTSFTGWNPLTEFLFEYAVPYAASCAIVAAVAAAVAGAF